MSLALLLGLVSSAALCDAAKASATASSGRAPAITQPVRQFRRIEQPFMTKAIVTLAGIGLIGLELWWFLGSKPHAKPEPIKPEPEDS